MARLQVHTDLQQRTDPQHWNQLYHCLRRVIVHPCSSCRTNSKDTLPFKPTVSDLRPRFHSLKKCRGGVFWAATDGVLGRSLAQYRQILQKSRRFSIKPAALHQLLKGVTELSALSHPTGCYPYHCHHPVPQSVQICIRCQSLRHLHTLHAAFHHHPIHQHPACRGWI